MDTSTAAVAYQGNSTCTSWLCPRANMGIEGCFGWHCAICDEPSARYGHPKCQDEHDGDEHDPPSDIEHLAEQWGWAPQAVAFALGLHDDNVAEAKAYLEELEGEDP